MRRGSPSTTLWRRTMRLLALGACTLGLLCAGHASAAGVLEPGKRAAAAAAGAAPAGSATLEECVTSVVQAERSATFAGDMSALGGSVRMAMRIDVQERLAGERLFHTITASGLGVWRASDPKVKVYKYVKQVTNLSSPATYRALVRFRWLGAKGHVLKRAERLTRACQQPAAPPGAAASAP